MIHYLSPIKFIHHVRLHVLLVPLHTHYVCRARLAAGHVSYLLVTRGLSHSRLRRGGQFLVDLIPHPCARDVPTHRTPRLDSRGHDMTKPYCWYNIL